MNQTNQTTSYDYGGDSQKEVQWWELLVIIGLSLLTGVFSGLNLGIISLDLNYLELLAAGPYETPNDERDARYAKRIIPLRKKGNLLLCTIILGNVSVNSILSIMMADLTSGLIGTIISTLVIVVFGEILPQSVFSRHALVVGANLSWLLWFFLALTFPISFPLSAVLDKLVGKEDYQEFNKTKMKKLFEIYEHEKLLDPSERKILSAALEFQEKTAESVMTSLDKCFMLDINSVLDRDMLRQIYTQGFSRIPVYQGSRDKIVGILMARDLILINPDKQNISIRQLKSILMKNVIQIDGQTKLDPILTYFKKGQSHMAIITKVEQYENKDPQIIMTGIVTLEDIMEELLEADNDGVQQLQFKDHNLISLRENLRLKEKLVLLFSSKQGGKELSKEEQIAVCEFLQKQVKAFGQNRLRKKVLQGLINDSTIEEITSSYNSKQKQSEESNSDNESKQSKYKSIHKVDGIVKAHTQKYFKVYQTGERKLSQDDMDQASPGMIKLTLGGVGDKSKIKRQLTTELSDKKEIDDPEEQKSFLFKKGEQSDEFILVLQGNVAVQTGEDNFQVTLSTFNHLAVDALINDSYTPDFTARVSQYARVLRINRVAYRKAISDPKNFEK
eukprot:403376482